MKLINPFRIAKEYEKQTLAHYSQILKVMKTNTS